MDRGTLTSPSGAAEATPWIRHRQGLRDLVLDQPLTLITRVSRESKPMFPIAP